MKVRLLVGTLAVLLLCLSLSVTASDVRRALATVLVAGTPSTEVLSALDSLQVQYGGHFSHLSWRSEVHGALLHGEAYWLTGALRGPRVRLGNPLSDGIFLVFKFDRSLLLEGWEIEYGWTLP